MTEKPKPWQAVKWHMLPKRMDMTEHLLKFPIGPLWRSYSVQISGRFEDADGNVDWKHTAFLNDKLLIRTQEALADVLWLLDKQKIDLSPLQPLADEAERQMAKYFEDYPDA
jgi:hypothetical protein